jgi:hypothetical protein
MFFFKKNIQKECLICFEYKKKDEVIINFIHSYYLKKCLCTYFIHKSCLDEWYNVSKSCLICRKCMRKNKKNNCKIKTNEETDIYKKVRCFVIIFFVVFNFVYAFLFLISIPQIFVNK